MTELVVEEINTTVVVEEQSTQVFVSPPENAIDIFEESVEVTVLDNDAQVVIYQGALVNGGGGGSSFVFTQSVPSLAWVVFHDLGTKPQITVVVNGVQEMCRITYPNDQSALLEFNSATSGQAFCLG